MLSLKSCNNKDKIPHQFIFPAVKSFERLPMNVKILSLQLSDSVLLSGNLGGIRRVKTLQKVGAKPAFQRQLAKELDFVPRTEASDSTVGNVKESLFLTTNRAGSWIATNTDCCLHYSSRTVKLSERLISMFLFVEHYSTCYLPVFS